MRATEASFSELRKSVTKLEKKIETKKREADRMVHNAAYRFSLSHITPLETASDQAGRAGQIPREVAQQRPGESGQGTQRAPRAPRIVINAWHLSRLCVQLKGDAATQKAEVKKLEAELHVR